MSFASLAPAVQAGALLKEWEQHPGRTRPPDYTATRPARLAHLAALCAALRPEAEVNIDHEDIRTILRGATDFRIGTAAATGPGRAVHVAEAALAALQLPGAGAPAGPARSALLGIVSPVTESLEMDELTTITETIQPQLGQELEMIFGHGETADATDTELRVWLLVGYAAEL